MRGKTILDAPKKKLHNYMPVGDTMFGSFETPTGKIWLYWDRECTEPVRGGCHVSAIHHNETTPYDARKKEGQHVSTLCNIHPLIMTN